jgi:hypothetical protein
MTTWSPDVLSFASFQWHAAIIIVAACFGKCPRPDLARSPLGSLVTPMRVMKECTVTNLGRRQRLPPATPCHEAEYDQQHDCAYKRVNNQRNDPHTEVDV